MGRKAWIFTITIVALLAVYFLASSITGYAVFGGPGEYDSFAQCLAEKDAKFYGAYWCPHCAEQKKVFGGSFKILEEEDVYVECSEPNAAGQTEICIAEGIQSYPTWEFANGDRVGAVLTIAQLSDLSGCPLPAE